MGDWAEEKAWKWDGSAEGGFNPDVQSRVQSLAALLREVKVGEYPCVDCGCLTILQPDQYKMDILAEVRRVVSECPLISEEARRALIRELEHV